MLPGDYIAMKLTGEIQTTVSGLSEGILWDFQKNSPAEMVLKHYGFSPDIIPEIVPTFAVQGQLTNEAAAELGLSPHTKVSYRAGDQPNNALSLNVLNPGEVAANAGTSGVVYGVSEEIKYDPQSRVNTFAHVNHSADHPRLGVLLCINGTGILNAWMKRIAGQNLNYSEMNELAASVPIGSDRITILPFGNGAERVLNNRDVGRYSAESILIFTGGASPARCAGRHCLLFQVRHGCYGKNGNSCVGYLCGKSKHVLSPVFRDTLAGVTGAAIELYDTDGSAGAARGAGIGSGFTLRRKKRWQTSKNWRQLNRKKQKCLNIWKHTTSGKKNWKNS